jgi:hypothetical protein
MNDSNQFQSQSFSNKITIPIDVDEKTNDSCEKKFKDLLFAISSSQCLHLIQQLFESNQISMINNDDFQKVWNRKSFEIEEQDGGATQTSEIDLLKKSDRILDANKLFERQKRKRKSSNQLGKQDAMRKVRSRFKCESE